MRERILVMGHRGCRGLGNPPENSLAAFQAAIDQGADGFELDVFLTRDGKLVVFHDDTLERMTNGTGHLVSFTLAQLRQLRLKDSRAQLTDQMLPTLDEVLDLVAVFRGSYSDSDRKRHFVVNIEIKEMPGQHIAKAVAEVVDERCSTGWDLSNFQVSSFDLACLRRMMQINAAIPRGALLHGGQRPWDISVEKIRDRLDEVRELKPETVNITLPSLNAESVALIRSVGAEPLAWTCDEKNPDLMTREERQAVAHTLFDNKTAAIITDYPGPMQQLLGNFFDGR